MRRALPGLLAACLLPLLAACSLVGGGDRRPDATISPPPGMKAVSLVEFAFGVPSDWTQDVHDTATYWKDPDGDTVMSESGGTIIKCPKPAKVGTRDADTGQTITSVRHFHVPGAGGALRYRLTGGQGGNEVELLAWLPDCKSELDLDIYAIGDADRIADTLIARP